MTVVEATVSREAAGATLRTLLIPRVRPSDLARQAGVSRQYVSDVLAGKRPPSAKLLSAAAELGLPIHALVDR
jgi:transcriptional regulator with XRE-family HTH domain